MRTVKRGTVGQELAAIRRFRKEDLDRVKKIVEPGDAIMFYGGSELARRGEAILHGTVVSTSENWFIAEAKTRGKVVRKVFAWVDLMLWEAEIARRRAGIPRQRLYMDFVLLGDELLPGDLVEKDFIHPDEEKPVKAKKKPKSEDSSAAKASCLKKLKKHRQRPIDP